MLPPGTHILPGGQWASIPALIRGFRPNHRYSAQHFSGLNEHRFQHNFSYESPLHNRKEGIESTVHLFLHCPLYQVHRHSLLGEVSDVLNNDVTQLPGDHLCDLLLFGSQSFNEITKRMILDATVSFIIHTNRFK